MRYKTKGTCSSYIDVELDGNVIKEVKFSGGCNGNTQGVARLVQGMDVDEAIARMEGINCSGRGTSCPDQLSKALRIAKEAQVARA